jgi:hypothetical protein
MLYFTELRLAELVYIIVVRPNICFKVQPSFTKTDLGQGSLSKLLQSNL